MLLFKQIVWPNDEINLDDGDNNDDTYNKNL